jgi:hypothetical protein
MQENDYYYEEREEEEEKSNLNEPIYETIYENSTNSLWNKNTNLFYSIQILCLSSLLLCSFGLIGLTFWLNFNKKYQLINKLSNDINYTTINKLVIGYLNYTFIFISVVSLSLDLVQIYLFRKSRNFLNSYDSTGIEKIKKNFDEETNLRIPINLNKRIKTRKFRHKIRSFKLLIEFSNFVYNLIYIIFVISLKFLIGIWLERYINEIVNNQIPVTLWKLFKEFEGLIVNEEEIGSKEMNLVNHVQKNFECCHYLNPYQYNTYKILNCNLRTSCLKPVQYFFINTYYYILLFLLLSSSISLLFLIFQYFNYRLVLIKKLLYSYKSKI